MWQFANQTSRPKWCKLTAIRNIKKKQSISAANEQQSLKKINTSSMKFPNSPDLIYKFNHH